MKRRAHRAALVLTLALALTACGGDDEDAEKDKPASSGPTVSAEVRDYRDAVAKVCEPAMKGMRKIADGLTVEGSTKAEQDAAIAEIGQAFLDEVAALRKIEAPDEIAADVDAWLDGLARTARDLKTKGAALLSGDTPPMADAEARAKALGVEGCVTPPA